MFPALKRKEGELLFVGDERDGKGRGEEYVFDV